MSYAENAKKLVAASDFGEIFELVKKAAEQSLEMHRAGLTLILGDLPNSVGAYHELGSNAIVMNRNLVKIIWEVGESQLSKNSYVFMILLHEYLHSLGFTDDAQVRDLGKKIGEDYLGQGHPAADMAVSSIDKFFPEVANYTMFRDRGSFETVTKFDSSSISYIG